MRPLSANDGQRAGAAAADRGAAAVSGSGTAEGAAGASEPAEKRHRFCPRCGSSRLHRSRRRGLVFALSLLGARILRCHDCRSRQAWFGPIPLPLNRPGVPEASWEARFMAGLGLALAAALIWWRFKSE